MGPIRFASFVLALLVAASRAFALPAFPGAEGFGATTPGGRGGAVVEVTSLADEGPGTLRAALEDTAGPRTVVFRVSGTITSSRHILLRGEAGSWVTVAGQTAPGDGVQILRGVVPHAEKRRAEKHGVDVQADPHHGRISGAAAGGEYLDAGAGH